MTTVVFYEGILASDSQTTGPGVQDGHCPSCDEQLDRTHSYRNKVIAAAPGIKFGDEEIRGWAGSGNSSMIKAFTLALQKGMEVKVAYHLVNTAINGDRARGQNRITATILLVGATSVWTIELGKPTFHAHKQNSFPVIIGSGTPAARFAIKHLNATAVGGIVAAIEGDIYSGGEINYLDCWGEMPEGEERKASHFKWTDDDTREWLDELLT